MYLMVEKIVHLIVAAVVLTVQHLNLKVYYFVVVVLFDDDVVVAQLNKSVIVARV